MVQKTAGSLERPERPPIDRRPDVPAHVVRGLKRHLGGRSQRFPLAACHSRSVAQGEHPGVALHPERLVGFRLAPAVEWEGHATASVALGGHGFGAHLRDRDDCFRLKSTTVLTECLVLASGND
jgi:hypothetical protein